MDVKPNTSEYINFMINNILRNLTDKRLKKSLFMWLLREVVNDLPIRKQNKEILIEKIQNELL